jgi:PilZ domain
LNQSQTPETAITEQRRSTRVVRAFPITVRGRDALHEPFTEQTSTVMVSCHGCKYQSKHYVPRDSVIELEIARSKPNAPARKVTGKVIWVQRPRNAKDILHVGLDFEVAGNVWDIPSPPGDWFPIPGEAEFPAPESDEQAAPCSESQSIESADSAASWDESEIVSASKVSDEIELETASQAEETSTLEIVSGDTAVNAGIREIIEKTVEAAIERLAKSIADDARNERVAIAAQLDAKVQQAVEAAIARLPSVRVKKSKKKN